MVKLSFEVILTIQKNKFLEIIDRIFQDIKNGKTFPHLLKD